jgi:hypothetical protein
VYQVLSEYQVPVRPQISVPTEKVSVERLIDSERAEMRIALMQVAVNQRGDANPA